MEKTNHWNLEIFTLYLDTAHFCYIPIQTSEYCQSFTFIKNHMMPLQSNAIQANKSECKVEFECN